MPTLPLVAILRGLSPGDAEPVGAILFDAGLSMLEVPLNRPGALASIAVLARMAPPGAMVGGGTMLSITDVEAVHAAGGRLLVAPNCNTGVIARGVALGMLCAPGVATPTEAFSALSAGAHALKIYPAEMVGYRGLAAMKTVLPADTPLWPVGGISPHTMHEWRASGATGFGIGAQLFAPGIAPGLLAARAREFVKAWHEQR
jgi:2-dehydro-3-deoxyphosphogalactonate aldolase